MTPTPVSAACASELTQALHVFISHLDERRYDALVATFAPGGRWLRQGRWLEGRAAILEALAARPAGMRVRHVMSNAWVRPLEGGDVHQEAYMTAYRQGEAEPVASLFRINRVSSVWRRCGEGWELVEQQLIPDLEFGS